MLHCASKAVVGRPLAFDAGVLPDWATGAGVAQIQGVVCEPSSTGPPIGWFVITRRASRPPRLSPATRSLRPSTRPRTSPRSVRAAALAVNAPVTSWPLSDSRTWFSATLFGTRTSTRASPPLMRSARFDSGTISKLDGRRSSPARAATRNTALSARNDSLDFIVSSSRAQYSAYRRQRDQRVRVRLQEESLRHGVGCGLSHGCDVTLVIDVTLLQRQPRVAAGQALGPGLRERDHSAGVITDLVFVEPGRGDVPTEVCTERGVPQHHGHAAEFIAVGVNPRSAHCDDLLDARRHHGLHARCIAVVELRTEVVIENRVDQAGRCPRRDARNAREPHRLFGGFDQSGLRFGVL